MKLLKQIECLLGLGSVTCCLFAATLAAAQGGANTMVLKEGENGKTIELPMGEELIVRLPAQLGTGFSWALVHHQGDALRLIQQRTESSGQVRPGGAEEQIFVFLPRASGSEEVELAYRRPWEANQPPARVFRFRATVTGSR